MNPIVVIPTRLGSSRLPGKALKEIAGTPMIAHVWRRGIEADVGPVIVAAGDQAIVDVIESIGGRAILTDPSLPSGSDRAAAALRMVDPDGRYDTVICLQGDLPTIEPTVVRATLEPLAREPACDIATLATVIGSRDELEAAQVVKAALAIEPDAVIGRAIYFSRAIIPAGADKHFHHVGLYTYRRSALQRYVALPEGILERIEKLEQLRALEHGMRIDVRVVETEPLGVDTDIDLERARVQLAT